MNVQWNSKPYFQAVSRDRSSGLSGETNRGQTGRTKTVSVITARCQTRQNQLGSVRQFDREHLATHFRTVFGTATSNLAAINNQATPQHSGSERAVRPDGSFLARKHSLTARGILKAGPRSIRRAQASGRLYGQEELPLLNDSGETT